MTLKKTTIAPPRMDFVKEDYETLIYQKGRRVWYEKAIKCPCKSKATNANSTCKNCGGLGWIFTAGKETRMVVTGVSFSNEVKQWSEEERGMVSITCSNTEQLTHMDRVTLLDAKSIHTEVVHLRKRVLEDESVEYYAWTVYNIKELLYGALFISDTAPLQLLNLDEDIEFGQRNLIKLTNTEILDGIEDDEDVSITLRYFFSTTYHIVEMKRETVQSFRYNNGDEENQDLPISAMARRAHLELDPMSLDGDTLFENLYPENNPCDEVDINAPTVSVEINNQFFVNVSVPEILKLYIQNTLEELIGILDPETKTVTIPDTEVTVNSEIFFTIPSTGTDNINIVNSLGDILGVLDIQNKRVIVSNIGLLVNNIPEQEEIVVLENLNIILRDISNNLVTPISINLEDGVLTFELVTEFTLSVNGDLFEVFETNSFNLTIVNSNDEEVGTIEEVEGDKFVLIGDTDISVNTTPLTTVKAEGSLNLQLADSEGSNIPFHSLEAPNKINVPDGSIELKRSNNTTLRIIEVKSNEVKDETIADTVVQLKDSGGNNLGTPQNFLAETSNGEINAPDGQYENSDGSITGTIRSGQTGKIISDIDIEVNTVKVGEVVSLKKVNINLEDSDGNPVVPDNISVNNNTIDLTFPPINVGLVDRFGNDLGTKQVSANANWDLRTLTPFDWADLYLSRLINPPTGAQEAAYIQFITDQVASGIFQRRVGMFPIIGGNSDDVLVNSAYPFDSDLMNFNAQLLSAPSINSDGITIANSQCFIFAMSRIALPINSLNVFVYSRTDNLPTGLAFDYTCQIVTNGLQNYLGIRDNNTNRSFGGVNGVINVTGTNSDSRGGYHLNGISGVSACKTVKNGNTASPLTTFTIGSGANFSFHCFGSLFGNSASNRQYAGFAVGLSLTDTQMQEDYAQWQTLNTALNRQV